MDPLPSWEMCGVNEEKVEWVSRNSLHVLKLQIVD